MHKPPICHTTPRLELLREYAANASAAGTYTAADIGCDHAYLSILLASSNTCAKVIASDIATGPVDKARANIARFGMDSRIDLRQGDGLSALAIGEADTIIIAGMGGRVIADILHTHPQTAKSAQKLILQPMTYANHLRRYLYENGYAIAAEDLVMEDRRIYSVITVVAGNTPQFSEADTYLSPALLKSGSPLLEEFILRRLNETQKILAGLRQGNASDAEMSRYQQLAEDIQRLYKETII